MTTTERSTVVGVFESDDRAREAVNELEKMGFTADQIGYAGHGGDAVSEDKATNGPAS